MDALVAFLREGVPVDVVIDTIGGDIQKRSFAVLRPGGVLVSAVSPPDQEQAKNRGARALFFVVNVTSADLSLLAELFDSKKLAVSIGEVLPLSEAREAHEMLDGMRPRPRGRIVLKAAD